ncbi:type VI secretion system Vgr family protein [Dyella caseinilytica]|uniref:Type VI secretion system tip protein VgrG n=1 Tax=Dyella caseinilytica TaxID=1849581 RepID=A0ABX7GUS6_9GAMM|nr:type VI secretion system Vgr family protein [Dyella caseinilytica]QRN54045.1 type VI secretion system tip protein VgrG [Dyella caseinilytica]GFZ91184.1 type IV secretion protein Rhs [Dyella caseinilytica]
MPTSPPSTGYALHVTGSPALLSVLTFSGKEALSTPYRFEIDVTSPIADLPMASILGQPARFTLQPIDTTAVSLRARIGDLADAPAPTRVFHGLITQFDQLSTSADQTHYRLVLEPRLADLSRDISSRLFQQQSAPEMIEAVLRHAGFTANDFQFQLRATYPTREYTTQYDESALAFLQRIAADEGIWFRFTQTDDHDLIVFGDDVDAYDRRGLSAPLRPNAGLESTGAEAIQSLTQQRRRVTQSVRLNDDHHRTAGVSLLTDINLARDDRTTQGTDDRWGEHQKSPDDAQRLARLRHQAHLTQQVVYEGTGNVLAIAPGRVLQLSDTTLPDAPHGLLITAVTHTAARDQAYTHAFHAMPADRPYRSPPLPWPSIDGFMPARITSPGNYTYAYLTPEGEYRVQLPFDLDTWSPGGTSRPVRLLRPYAGDDYGYHFPLIDGAEVYLGFTQGDPDRPYIVGAVHNSQRTDLVTNQNNTRNRIRTASGNELRMEDREGREHIHVTTPTQTSELNLGHMVDAQNTERGIGAELRTDGHATIRGGKGVFLSADAQANANGSLLDMQPAIDQLQRRLREVQAMAAAVRSANAIEADVQAQQTLFDNTLKQLRQAGLLISAPDGIGVTSGSHLQMSAKENLIGTTGGHLDIGVSKSFTVAAGEAVSLFAQKLGAKFIAAQGKVDIQAQKGEMNLSAQKDVTVTSGGKLQLAAAKEIWLSAGGSYIKITATGIESGTPGDILEKCAYWETQGPASMQITDVLKDKLPTQPLFINMAASPASKSVVSAGMPYELFADGALVKQGLTDASGQIPIDHQAFTQHYRLELGNGAIYAIPVTENFRGDATNGQLANRGFHYHEGAPDNPADAVDRAAHRQVYNNLLSPTQTKTANHGR